MNKFTSDESNNDVCYVMCKLEEKKRINDHYTTWKSSIEHARLLLASTPVWWIDKIHLTCYYLHFLLEFQYQIFF